MNKSNKNRSQNPVRPKRQVARRQSSRQAAGNGRAVIPRQREVGLTPVQELWTPLFPARCTKRLRYSTTVGLSSASGVVATHVFSANGLFDPDVSGTGHQPMGFDQMMLSYNHYVVSSAKITCVFKNLLTSAPTASISIAASPTPITVIDQIMEFGLVNTEVLEAKGAYGSNKILTSGCSIAKIQGVRDVVDVTDLQGNVAANPVEQTYFHVQLWDTAAITGGVTIDVIIEYNAIFTEPRALSTSDIAKMKLLGLFDNVERKQSA